MRVLLTVVLASMPLFAEEKISEADAKAKVDAWKEAAKAGTIEGKQAAIEGLVECRHPVCAGTLMQIACSDIEDLRIRAARGLGKWTGSLDAAKALHGAIKANEKKPDVYQAVFDAMGDVGHPTSVDVLKDLVGKWDDDEEVAIATAAVEALGGFRTKAAVEAALDLWQKNKVGGRGKGEAKIRGHVREASRKALSRLLGEEFLSLEDAEDWWQKNRASLKDDLTRK